MQFYFYIFLILFATACKDGHKKKNYNLTYSQTSASNNINNEAKINAVNYVNSIRISNPHKGSIHKFKEKVDIVVRLKKKFKIDSCKIFINGMLYKTSNTDTTTFKYTISSKKAGNNTIKVICFHPENKRGIATTNFIVAPDFSPHKVKYKILNTYPHDNNSYTQGLIYYNNHLYEGTGQYGKSVLRKNEIISGKAIEIKNLDKNYFGEGITIYKDKIYQLTWKSNKGFIYDIKTFEKMSTFDFFSEGWGITTIDKDLVISDGSNKLYFIDPDTFTAIKSIEVYDDKGEVKDLNELEYVDGIIWANVWLTYRVVGINPNNGAVVKEIDFSKILTDKEKTLLSNSDDVLNGIAWNPIKNTFYFTGKKWPKLFEIKLME